MGKGGISSDGQEVNMAAWLFGVNDLRIQPFKLQPLGANDVKIRMKAVGICGSDVHYLKHMRCGDFVVNEPMVIGHECAGVVEEVGSDVKSLVVGDRVAMEPGISCWHCFHCKGGSYNLCPDMKFFATPPIHGSLADQVVHPADLCFKLPENMSLEEGAMCEPLSVGVHACRRANVTAETTVLILGAGPIGLVTMLTARSFGAPKIVLVDVDSHRLSVAKKLGADAVVQVSTNTEDVSNEVAQIQEAMGAGIDVTFDCVGFSKTMTTALTATTSGGKVCLVGMGHNEMKVSLTPAAAREVDIVGIFRYKNTWPLCIDLISSGKIDVKPLITHFSNFYIFCREVDIVGIFRYKNTWPLCIDLISSGKIDVKPLITHRFRFSQDEVEKAFETSAKGSDAIKVMFNL